MLRHVCDVAYNKNMCGPIRTCKYRSTNWLITICLVLKAPEDVFYAGISKLIPKLQISVKPIKDNENIFTNFKFKSLDIHLNNRYQ